MKTKTLAALAGLCIAAPALAQTTYTGYAGGSPTAPGVAIPDNTTAGVSITISSTLGTAITDMVFTLQFGTGTTAGNREHSWIGDLVVTLAYTPTLGGPIAPVAILDRVGVSPNSTFGNSADMNGFYNFADAGSTLVTGAAGNINAAGSTVGGNIVSTVFTPDAVQANAYTAFVGTAQINNALAAFNTAYGTGTWTVFITDRAGGDTGDIISASVTLIPTPGAAALLGLGGLAAARRRRA
ncbi:MAG: hypothetical protein JNJ48_02490 [Phycisphaerae bacterium]|nr:hypothetical protein [Phycisphaerae bacterium]